MTNLRNRMAAKNHRDSGDWLPGCAPKRRKPAPRPPLALEAAKTRRLVSLLIRYTGGRPDVLELTEMATGEYPRGDYAMVSLCASLIVTRRYGAGLTWEEIAPTLKNQGRGPHEVQRYLRRAARALRLLDRLLTAGCIRRGEAVRRAA